MAPFGRAPKGAPKPAPPGALPNGGNDSSFVSGAAGGRREPAAGDRMSGAWWGLVAPTRPAAGGVEIGCGGGSTRPSDQRRRRARPSGRRRQREPAPEASGGVEKGGDGASARARRGRAGGAAEAAGVVDKGGGRGSARPRRGRAASGGGGVEAGRGSRRRWRRDV
ncbi:hypothetical protein PVAP13_3NG141362 [Panicum virgatum]|uniref:Uncharacterized protein n=1 Tax=Panicum virgatum TaxID=38727 RepID=A0A8T0U7Q6_PANVG|nr:hypothetical protein PVAP13_3NG141362 [Panicum virgatum]